MNEKALDKILANTKSKILAAQGPNKEKALREIEAAKDKNAKRSLIRKWLDLVPDGKLESIDKQVEQQARTKQPQPQLNEELVATMATTTLLATIGVTAAIGLVIGALSVAIPVIVGAASN